MAITPPTIDDRTARDIARRVGELLGSYVPTWTEYDPQTQTAAGVGGALIGIFARFSEIIIERLNQTPDKNFMAFLNLLGAALLPPQPARVPLTFSLAAGSLADGLVLVGTQVAAPPAEGAKDPVIFETERELTVTAARLASLFVRDPEQDKQADLQAVLTDFQPLGERIFQGTQPIEHALYVGHDLLLGFPRIIAATLIFQLAANMQDPRAVQWEVWDGLAWRQQAVTDLTQGLRISSLVRLGPLAPIPESQVNGLTSRWVRGRLLTPITPSSDPRENMVRGDDGHGHTQLPELMRVTLSVTLSRPIAEGLTPDAAAYNATPVDLGKDFNPFGEKPRRNDTFAFASREAFSKDSAGGLSPIGAEITVECIVANSHLLRGPNAVWPSADLTLSWECWNGAAWQVLGQSFDPPWLSLIELDPLPSITTDPTILVQGKAQFGSRVTTDAKDPVTGNAKSLSVDADGRFAGGVALAEGYNVLTFTASFQRRSVNTWAVVFRGPTKSVDMTATTPAEVVDTATTQVGVTIAVTGTVALIKSVRISNGSRVLLTTPLPAGGGIVIVPLDEGRNDLLIEGLDTGNVRVAATTLAVSRAAAQPPASGTFAFSDGTYGFCQSGLIQFILPPVVAPALVNGLENYWVRVRLVGGDYGKDAAYRLANPEKREEGFTLVLESFRPPVLTSLRIGYSQQLSGGPDKLLALNNMKYTAPRAPATSNQLHFAPFERAPEDRPTLYLGFLPPPATPFPNRTLSIYARVPDLKYGERAVPISPETSEVFTALPKTVIHPFVVTNTAAVKASFAFKVFGQTWEASTPPVQTDVDPGDSRTVQVSVVIPDGTPIGESDVGFLGLSNSAFPGVEYAATFETSVTDVLVAEERPQLLWEYWDGADWRSLAVLDDTENFTRPGLIEFLAPPDFSPQSDEFARPLTYWLRVSWQKGEYAATPKLCRLLLNTTMAAQTVTLRNEGLLPTTVDSQQTFRAARAPVLAGQQLQVREPEKPSAAELEVIYEEEGADALAVVVDATGNPKEVWVRWHEVSDFYASGPRSRHYVLNHLTGEIQFGDGLSGLTPPPGSGNVRLWFYQTGGGLAGNTPAGTITQLKTTVPYVDKVTNTEAAVGGTVAETLDSLREREPRTIRHGGRAVTVEDFEDLAMLASPEVARAKCVPLRNLIEDPFDEDPPIRGEVSVIIVPRTLEAMPQPSLELLSQVQDYLEAHAVPTMNVSVVGALYLRVEVKAEVVPVSLDAAGSVQEAIRLGLEAFLHPLTGGQDHTGWDFGREPHPSDVYALIETVPGVDHVRSLRVDIEVNDDVSRTGRFLIYSGTHTITLRFEQP